MKRRFALTMMLALTLAPLHAELTKEQCGRITKTVGQIIGQIHYRQTQLNDEISKHHLKNYLNALDFGHMIFLQSDVDSFEKLYGTRLDDQVRFGSLRPAHQIFQRYLERLAERQKTVTTLLEKPMDFSKKESFNPVRDELPWPKTADEANELWRKRVKFELLADRLTYAKDGEKPDAKKVEESNAKIQRRYERLLKTMKAYEEAEILELYLA